MVVRRMATPASTWAPQRAIWALDHLTRMRATRPYRSLVTLRRSLVDAAQKQRAALGNYGLHGSLHFGDFPALLVAMRLFPDAAAADAIHAHASDNNNLPPVS
jgi:hypothetical protein